ncbi:MAG: zf-HC2 domain-containing protein [Bryobacteraceae bacterium]
MTCLELDELFTDYLDGALNAEQRAAVDAHLAGCEECAELTRDASGAVTFIDRAAVVELPPALVSNILAELRVGPSRAVVQPSWIERIFGLHAGAILQPRFAMGFAMTVLSFAMIGKLAGTMNPARMVSVAENRMVRTWDRTVKGYENLALVADLQDSFAAWQQDNLQDGPQGLPGNTPQNTPEAPGR